jgi:hypothetical protein
MKKLSIFLMFFMFPNFASATTTTYTPLISADMFDGVRADVSTAAAGILSVLVIILAVALIARVIGR